jgi:hypothetical protein
LRIDQDVFIVFNAYSCDRCTLVYINTHVVCVVIRSFYQLTLYPICWVVWIFWRVCNNGYGYSSLMATHIVLFTWEKRLLTPPIVPLDSEQTKIFKKLNIRFQWRRGICENCGVSSHRHYFMTFFFLQENMIGTIDGVTPDISAQTYKRHCYGGWWLMEVWRL